jgi:hypothetical protein
MSDVIQQKCLADDVRIGAQLVLPEGVARNHDGFGVGGIIHRIAETRAARERGCPPLPELEFIHRSAHLNLFLYPEEADYERSRPLGPMWERLGSCVRKEGLGDFEVPKE